MPNFNNMLKGIDLQTIGAALAAVLAIIGVIAGISAAPGGSSNESSSTSIASTPEQRVRDAVIKNMERDGYTVDPTLNNLAQKYVKAEHGPERDAIYTKLGEAGMTEGSGGTFTSNEKYLIDLFSRSTETKPKHGGKVGVGVNFGPVTTEIQVVYAD